MEVDPLSLDNAQPLVPPNLDSGQLLVPLDLCRSNRSQQRFQKLWDYICHTVWSIPSTPIISTSPSSSVAQGNSSYPLTHYLSCDKFSHFHHSFLSVVSTGIEPTKYSEVAALLEWHHNMQQEISALKKNNTWTMTSLSLGKCILASKWVY